jgi:hypothetical protein
VRGGVVWDCPVFLCKNFTIYLNFRRFLIFSLGKCLHSRATAFCSCFYVLSQFAVFVIAVPVASLAYLPDSPVATGPSILRLSSIFSAGWLHAQISYALRQLVHCTCRGAFSSTRSRTSLERTSVWAKPAHVPFLHTNETPVLPRALLIIQRSFLVLWKFHLAVRPPSNVLDAIFAHHLFRHRVLVCVVLHHVPIKYSVIAWDGFVLRRPCPFLSPLAVRTQSRVHVFGFPDVEFTLFQLKDIDVLGLHSKTRGMRGGLCGIVSFFIKKYDLERSREVIQNLSVACGKNCS